MKKENKTKETKKRLIKKKAPIKQMPEGQELKDLLSIEKVDLYNRLEKMKVTEIKKLYPHITYGFGMTKNTFLSLIMNDIHIKENRENQTTKEETNKEVNKDSFKAIASPVTNNKQSEGLGDTVEKILNSKALKPIAKQVVNIIWGEDNEDCGCTQRKEKLNKMFPYNKPNCFNKQQYDLWTTTSKKIKKTNLITQSQQDIITMLMRDILNLRMTNDSCKGCSGSVWRKYIQQLDEVANTYENI